MGEGFYRPLRALLLEAGCRYVRQGKGSHEVWCNPANGRQFPVAVTIVSRHLANAILKQAGLSGRL